MSSKEIPVDVEPGSPRTLREFLDLAERDAAWRNRQVDLPGLGATAHLLRLVLRDGSIAHVFGAAGERFFFGLLIKGKPPQVEPIPWAAIFDARDDDEKAEAPKEQQSASAAHYKSVNFAQSVRVISNGFTSNVKPLFQKPETHIYQITSREDQKHSLYWLAIDDEQKDNTVLFELAQIATEDEPYTSCGSSRTIGSAAKITVERGATFHAVLEVEPSHILDVEESAQPRDSNADPEDWCPSTLRLEWKNHSEWTPTDQKTHCLTPFSPRKISISDDGTITPTPIQVAKPDP
jgi:hypothetical protein